MKPVIPSRAMWREEYGPGSMLRQLGEDAVVMHDEEGALYCCCAETGEVRRMVYWGYEAKRRSLKYRCPAAVHGIECAGATCCCSSRYGRVVRVRLDDEATDRRVFVPLPRATAEFKREYAHRTAVERVNSRKGMELKAALALAVMLSMALAQVRGNRLDRLRSLVAA